jgi:hypothetical protein
VTQFSVDLETQEVLVTGTMPYDDVLAKIKKTGKEVSFISYRDGVNGINNYTRFDLGQL